MVDRTRSITIGYQAPWPARSTAGRGVAKGSKLRDRSRLLSRLARKASDSCSTWSETRDKLPSPASALCPTLPGPPQPALLPADSARDPGSGPTTSCPQFPPPGIARAVPATRSRRLSKRRWKNSSRSGTSATTGRTVLCTAESVSSAKDFFAVEIFISVSFDSVARIRIARRRTKNFSRFHVRPELSARRALSVARSLGQRGWWKKCCRLSTIGNSSSPSREGSGSSSSSTDLFTAISAVPRTPRRATTCAGKHPEASPD